MRENISAEVRSLVERVRRYSALPVTVGFGISKPEHVREVWSYADGAVVGSRLVLEIENHLGSPQLVENVVGPTRELRDMYLILLMNLQLSGDSIQNAF
jgi:tryptophan synthase alpha chain